MTDYTDLIARLRNPHCTMGEDDLYDAADMIEALQAEVEALRADALRYRWLRDYALMVDCVADSDNRVQIWVSGFGDKEVRSYGKTLDEAVDAAQEKKP